MKKVLSTLLVLCLLLGLTACGSEPAKTENTPTEEKTTTTTAPEETLSYDRIMKTVRQIMKNYSGYTGVTNEKTTQREDGTTARSFKYFDDLFTVTVSLEGDTVTDIIVLSDPNQLAKIHNDPYSTFVLVASFPALPFYDESKWDCDKKHTALANVLGDTAEVNLENNSIYSRYTEDGWQYVAQCTTFLCTFLVSAEKPATTTAATSQTNNQQPTSAQSTSSPTQNKPTATKRPTTSTKADPCANGHDWEEATCSGPATCSVCKKTSGSALPHDIDVAKCRNCDHTDFSQIAKTYSDISAYDLVTGEVYDVQNVKINSSGVFSFTFNGESYALKLAQKSHSYSYEPIVKFDCYRDGKKEVDAVVEVYTGYDNVRLTWRGLQGCQLYIYAE